jgi:uncharacterized protein (TIGR01777 family)
MQTILIAGGSGLIGTALSGLLVKEGYKVIVLSRNPRSAHDGIRYSQWNVKDQTYEVSAFQEADVIIHLAGENIAEKRWTARRKKEIRDSRVDSSALIIKALKETNNHVHTVIAASAIGWYGRDHKKAPVPFTEHDQPAAGFLGETCRMWEESIEPVKQLGKRLVKLRTGIVISEEGGAMAEFKKPLRFGIAAILGTGNQIISWIHIDDLCRIYLEAIRNTQLNGVYNAVAPEPCSNERLTLELAKQMRGSNFLAVHVPSFLLRLVLGEMSIEVLKSTTVSSKKLQQQGFQFQFPTIAAAVRALHKKV